MMALAEIVDQMIRLSLDHAQAIREKDQTDPAYLAYQKCVQLLGSYEQVTSAKIIQASGVYVPGHFLDEEILQNKAMELSNS